jgi:glycine/D-amino acid oxidase-like deaminating enzyme
MKKTRTTICGAGIAGIATAYYLSVKYGLMLDDTR